MALNFKFWSRGKSADKPPAAKKASGPKELPQQVGQHLIVKRKEDPDYVWSLRCVMQLREDDPDLFDIRLFNPEQADDLGIRVANYASLEDHPEMVIWQGWYGKRTQEVGLEPS